MKFKVGDRVKSLNRVIDTTDYFGTIVAVDELSQYPICVEWDIGVRYNYSLDSSALELVQSEVAKEPSIEEPIPGKYYRTRDGDKLHFIGKTRRGVYIYDDIDGDLREYSKPFQYWASESDNYDIVGEWVDAHISQNGLPNKMAEKLEELGKAIDDAPVKLLAALAKKIQERGIPKELAQLERDLTSESIGDRHQEFAAPTLPETALKLRDWLTDTFDAPNQINNEGGDK